MRISALIVSVVLFAAAPALADDTKKPDAAVGTSVEMPYLIAPLTSGENLLAYAYISCKIIGTSPSAAIDIRDKVPFIQDAFVRDVNATSVGTPDDPQAVDATGTAARLLADTRKVMGPGKVADIKLIQIQISPVQPGAAPPPS